MDNELALRLFVSVVDSGSFSNGGERLGVPQSSTSRMISQLENRLGARLLQRSTRNLNLTEAGKIYYERATKIVTELDEAANAVRDISAAPAGLLRVTAPASFGRHFIAPYLKEFHELWPDVTIGLSLTDSVEDVIGLGYDIAIRLGALEDSDLITRTLTKCAMIPCASPQYLKTNGTPATVSDLKEHNCLQFRSNPGQNTWVFVREGQEYSAKVGGSLYANNGEALLAAALGGLGICFLPEWLVREHLDAGTLRAVLRDHTPKTAAIPIQAVFAHRHHTPAKLRVFVDFLCDKLSAQPWVIS